jgi:hypothetical protein
MKFLPKKFLDPKPGFAYERVNPIKKDNQL